MHEKLCAVPTRAAFHRRRRGAQQLHAAHGSFAPSLERCLEERHRCGQARRFGAEQGEAYEGRPTADLAFFDGACREGVVTALQEFREQRVIRKLGLDQHLARSFRATRAARDLHDRLREPFARAEVRAEKSLVCVQHDDERDVREIVPLRQHLRPDENIDLLAVDSLEHRLEVASLADAVSVESRNRGLGKRCGNRLLDSLRALPDRFRG